jgi:hypothetical protein
MRILLIEILLILLMGAITPVSALSAESGWNEAGVRIGIQADSKHVLFHQYEAFAVYGMPWDWRSASGWGATPQANVSLGVLDGGGVTGFIGSLGTDLVFSKNGFGLTTDLGICASLFDRRQFDRQDFGSILLFGAYAGINYRFGNGIKIGYRIQHLSNGHIFYADETPNPGLDMHMIGISYIY